jgi:hypothetical protein
MLAEAQDARVATDVPPRPTTRPAELASLNEPQRRVYEAITARQMFLPYVRFVARAEPPGPVTPPQRTAPPEPPRPQAEWYEDLVLVGLPAIDEAPEVHLARSAQDPREPLKVGDRLGAMEVAMVEILHWRVYTGSMAALFVVTMALTIPVAWVLHRFTRVRS